MRLQQGLDLLHRRIEEWVQEAMMLSDAVDSAAEGFGEYGSDFIACLHEISEEMELSGEDLALAGADVSSRELCEELGSLLRESWERIEFAERPVGFRIEELSAMLLSVAAVLDAEIENGEEELDEAVDALEEFLVEAW